MAATTVDPQAIHLELSRIQTLMTDITRHTGPQTWQGGSAARFTQDLEGHNRSIAQMMRRIWTAVTHINGAPVPAAPPEMPRVSPVPSAPGVASVATTRMERLEYMLERAADELPLHARRIDRLLESGGGLYTASTTQCDRTAAWCHQQSVRMQLRVRYAKASDQVNVAWIVNAGMTTVPDADTFDTPELIQLARVQAQAYTHLLKNPSTTTQEQLTQIAQTLKENAQNPEYLKTFFDGIPPGSLAALARTLHKAHPDGKIVLDAADQRILQGFGTAVAAGTKKKLLTEQQLGELTGAKDLDMWSVAMLLKFGPDGGKWDTPFLARLTQSILTWSRDQRTALTPPEPAHGPYENFRIPYNTTEQWSKDLGLDPVEARTRGHDRKKVIRTIATWDPVIPVLTRSTENRTAAKLVLGDYNHPKESAQAARDLIDPRWLQATPGSKNLKEKVNAFLLTATAAPRGPSEEMHLSAQSFASILEAVNKLPETQGRYKVVIPPETRHTLTQISTAYALDLARSMYQANTGNGVSTLAGEKRYWLTMSNPAYVQAFLKKVLVGPVDIGRFKGSVDALTVAATRLESAGGAGDQDLILMLGRLQGARQLAENVGRLEGAQEKDRQAQINKARLDLLISYFGRLPTSGYGRDSAKEHAGLTFSQQLVDQTQPLMDMFMGSAQKNKTSVFFTGNEELARQLNQARIDDTRARMRSLVVAGLIASGRLKAPQGAAWFHNGIVAPFDDPDSVEQTEKTNLDAFVSNHSKTIDKYLQPLMAAFDQLFQVDKTGTPP